MLRLISMFRQHLRLSTRHPLFLHPQAQVIHHPSTLLSRHASTCLSRHASTRLSCHASTCLSRHVLPMGTLLTRPLIIPVVCCFRAMHNAMLPEIPCLGCHHCVCTVCRRRIVCAPLSGSEGVAGTVPDMPDSGSSDDNRVRWYVVTAG